MRPGRFPSLILVMEIRDLSEEDKEVCSCDPLPHSGQLEPAVAGERGGGGRERRAARRLTGLLCACLADLQAALKKYQTEQRSKGDALDKCQAELKKLRKKSQGSKNPQKYSDKELQVGLLPTAASGPLSRESLPGYLCAYMCLSREGRASRCGGEGWISGVGPYVLE